MSLAIVVCAAEQFERRVSAYHIEQMWVALNDIIYIKNQYNSRQKGKAWTLLCQKKAALVDLSAVTVLP